MTSFSLKYVLQIVYLPINDIEKINRIILNYLQCNITLIQAVSFSVNFIMERCLHFLSCLHHD